MPNASETQAIDAGAIVSLIEDHAQESLMVSPTNARYAERVTQNAQIVGELLSSHIGQIDGVVATWSKTFRPIAETIFGVSVEPDLAAELHLRFADYSPTVIDGISGRVRKISLDEIMGPLLTLDLVACSQE